MKKKKNPIIILAQTLNFTIKKRGDIFEKTNYSIIFNTHYAFGFV